MKRTSKRNIAVICVSASAILILSCVAVWWIFHLPLEAFKTENEEFLNEYGAWVEKAEENSEHKLNFVNANFQGGYYLAIFDSLDYDIPLNEQISLAYGTFSSFKEYNKKCSDNGEYAAVKIVFKNCYIEMNNVRDELRIFTNIYDDNFSDEICGIIKEKYDLIIR